MQLKHMINVLGLIIKSGSHMIIKVFNASFKQKFYNTNKSIT